MEALPNCIKYLILEFAQDVYICLNYDIITLSYDPPSIHTKIKYPDILYSSICSPIMRPETVDSICPNYKPHKINISDYLDEPICMFYDEIYLIDISIGRMSSYSMLIKNRLMFHSKEYIQSTFVPDNWYDIIDKSWDIKMTTTTLREIRDINTYLNTYLNVVYHLNVVIYRNDKSYCPISFVETFGDGSTCEVCHSIDRNYTIINSNYHELGISFNYDSEIYDALKKIVTA